MRLAVVTSHFPNSVQPYRGNATYQILRQMRDLAEIRVFCPLTRYPKWLPPRNFPFYHANLNYSLSDVDAEYFEYPAFPIVSRPFNPAVCKHYLSSRLAAFKPEAILNYFVYPEGCAAVSLHERLGVPVVLGVIGSDVNRIPDRVTSWHTQRALRRADGVIAVSEQTRQKAVALGARENRTWTVSLGCDLEIFRPIDQKLARERLSISNEMELIVFVGWISKTKGVLELLDAVARLAHRRQRLKVALIGEGALSEQIAIRAQAGSLQGRVLMPGALTSKEIALWMSAADVFCLPSHAEGSPNAVIEALSCGTPVVATDVGGIPQLVKKGSGLLIPPKDSLLLERALEECLETTWDRPAIAARSTRSWRNCAEDTWSACCKAFA